jgi:hypothetical protein
MTTRLFVPACFEQANVAALVWAKHLHERNIGIREDHLISANTMRNYSWTHRLSHLAVDLVIVDVVGALCTFTVSLQLFPVVRKPSGTEDPNLVVFCQLHEWPARIQERPVVSHPRWEALTVV